MRGHRGKIETYLMLLAGFDGTVARTKVIAQYCGLAWGLAMTRVDFLEENGFLRRVSHRGSRHTYARTEKGDKVLSIFSNELQEFVGDVLSSVYKKMEDDKSMVRAVPRKILKKPSSGFRSTDEQRLDVLKVLADGQRYPVTRVKSYARISPGAIEKLVAGLERDGLITLHPNQYKHSKGDYGISSKGMTHLLDASRKKR